MTELPPSVLAALSDGVVTLDEEFRCRTLNDAATRLLGGTEARLCDTPVWTVLPGVDEASLRKNVAEMDGESLLLGRTNLGDCGRVTVTIYPADAGYTMLLTTVSTPAAAGEGAPASVDGEDTERDRVEPQLAETIMGIETSLTEAATSVEVEQDLCALLGDSGLYRLVWVAAYTPGWEQLEPRARAGQAAEFMGLHDLALDEGGRLGALLRTVIDSAEPAVIRNIGTDPTTVAWRDEAAAYDLEAVALVPVVHRATVSGVVACYTDRTDAFGHRERQLLASVGTTLGRAVHTLELERLIHSETVVELTFESTDRGSFLVAASQELGCDIEVLASLPSGEGSLLYYAAVDGCAPAALEEHCRDSDGVDAVRLVDGSGEAGGVFELETDRRTLASELVASDAVVTTHRVVDGQAEVVCEVAAEKSLGGLLGRLTEQFPDTELRSKRQRDRAAERATRAGRGIARSFETELTERQRQCLLAAVYGGYFASPRKSTGREIAAALSMTQPTFSYHLRKAQQQLFETLLQTDSASGPTASDFHR